MSTPFQYSADGQSLYYAITERGVSNLVQQQIGTANISPITNLNELTIYAFDVDWNNKRMAFARGRTNTDVVLLTQQPAQ
jgi:hypothetical protein